MEQSADTLGGTWLAHLAGTPGPAEHLARRATAPGSLPLRPAEKALPHVLPVLPLHITLVPLDALVGEVPASAQHQQQEHRHHGDRHIVLDELVAQLADTMEAGDARRDIKAGDPVQQRREGLRALAGRLVLAHLQDLLEVGPAGHALRLARPLRRSLARINDLAEGGATDWKNRTIHLCHCHPPELAIARPHVEPETHKSEHSHQNQGVEEMEQTQNTRPATSYQIYDALIRLLNRIARIIHQNLLPLEVTHALVLNSAVYTDLMLIPTNLCDVPIRGRPCPHKGSQPRLLNMVNFAGLLGFGDIHAYPWWRLALKAVVHGAHLEALCAIWRFLPINKSFGSKKNLTNVLVAHNVELPYAYPDAIFIIVVADAECEDLWEVHNLRKLVLLESGNHRRIGLTFDGYVEVPAPPFEWQVPHHNVLNLYRVRGKPPQLPDALDQVPPIQIRTAEARKTCDATSPLASAQATTPNATPQAIQDIDMEPWVTRQHKDYPLPVYDQQPDDDDGNEDNKYLLAKLQWVKKNLWNFVLNRHLFLGKIRDT